MPQAIVNDIARQPVTPSQSTRQQLTLDFAVSYADLTNAGRCGDNIDWTNELLAETSEFTRAHLAAFRRTRLRKGDVLFIRERGLSRLVRCIPIVSTHSPDDWNYRSISIVTAQTVTAPAFLLSSPRHSRTRSALNRRPLRESFRLPRRCVNSPSA